MAYHWLKRHSRNAADRNHNTPQVQTMYTSYEDSVLAHADDDGNLTRNDAIKLLSDHGFSLDDMYEDNHGVSWAHLDARNADALLAWLGY